MTMPITKLLINYYLLFEYLVQSYRHCGVSKKIVGMVLYRKYNREKKTLCL